MYLIKIIVIIFLTTSCTSYLLRKVEQEDHADRERRKALCKKDPSTCDDPFTIKD